MGGDYEPTVERFFLPFLLLACNTLLPPCVLDLAKKPCVVALFFFFGLYVNDIIYNNIHYFIEKTRQKKLSTGL